MQHAGARVLDVPTRPPPDPTKLGPAAEARLLLLKEVARALPEATREEVHAVEERLQPLPKEVAAAAVEQLRALPEAAAAQIRSELQAVPPAAPPPGSPPAVGERLVVLEARVAALRVAVEQVQAGLRSLREVLGGCAPVDAVAQGSYPPIETPDRHPL
jgi:hypothetical protein